jgi:hypothetical protein
MLHHGRNRVKWRGTPIPPGPWPAILKVGFEQPLIKEDWTLTASQDPQDHDVYRFEVTGSVTGPDGHGRTDKRFVSQSGRVVIEPEDWDVRFAIMTLRRLEQLPAEFQLDWSVMSDAVDVAEAPEPVPGVERVVTVAARLADQRHRLELVGNVDGVEAIRVYTPSKFPRPSR